MSWDVDLYIPIESAVLVTSDGQRTFQHPRFVYGSWNYTHNCNPMIRRVLDLMRVEYAHLRVTDDGREYGNWYDLLDGATGELGADLLDLVVNAFMEAPGLFREMNPENGWGDYDSLLEVLAEMRDAGRRHPTALWSASG